MMKGTTHDMSEPPSQAALHLPARDIPIPSSVSAEAQAVMAMPGMVAPEFPELGDLEGWRAMIESRDAEIVAAMSLRAPEVPVTTVKRDLGGFGVFEITPDGVADEGNVYLDIHGGAFIYGRGESCRIMCTGTATRNAAKVWAVDYRMPPDHPFPVGLEDCLAAYRALLEAHRPDQIIVGGASAGGNLAAALMLRARAEGLPPPAALVLLTPAVDLTESGDSWQTNRGLDPLLAGDSTALALYVNGHDPTDPLLSPLFGDLERGFPPTILTTGTRDMLLSDTVRMHRALRAAGVVAELHVQEAAGHGGFFGMAPEDQEILSEVRRFVDTHWGRATP
jgi:monoterpene epsilon-lactone hydrolase